jgi:hypothetical protein
MLVIAPKCSINAQKNECALIVFVVEEGKPVNGSNVDLLDSTGKVVQSKKSINGKADFCDFGFGLHSVRIWNDYPGEYCQTIAKGFTFIQQFSQHVTIVTNRCLGDVGQVVGGNSTTCDAFLRISSPDGTKLPGVSIKSNQKQFGPQTSDQYGRAHYFIDIHSKGELTLSKEGYETKTVPVECSGQWSTEKIPVLLDLKKK